MTIKIGRAAIGQKFFSPSGGHVYTVLAYVPAGEPYTYRNGPMERTYPFPRYIVESQYDDREAHLDHRQYLTGAKLYLAARPLPV